MSYLALSASFEYLCYGFTAIINISVLSARGLNTSQSDVYRCHILRYKDSLHTERVNKSLFKHLTRY